MREGRVRASALAFAMGLAGCGGGSTPAAPGPVGGCTMQESAVANEGWLHVPEGSAIAYMHNPPASGPHYPVWLRYEAFSSPMARGYWVHNLEHGAVVLLHRPDAPPDVVAALRSAYNGLAADAQCGHNRAVLTPDPLLDTPVAVVAADVVLRGSCVSPAAISAFVNAHRAHAPENVCTGGTRP